MGKESEIMKKTLSLVLSVVMLLSCFTLGGVNAFAYTKDNEPTVYLGETFTVNVPYTKSTQEMDINNADVFFASFTPDETGYYEFAFDKKFSSSSDDDALISAIYSVDEDDLVNMSLCMKITDDIADIAALLGVSDNPSVAAKLTAGKTYSLVIITDISTGFSSNVTIQSHTHTYKTYTEKSYVDTDSFANNYDGEKYTGCTANNCDYHKTVEKYYKVKSVKLKNTNYTFNGKAKKPAVTVKDSKGNVLKKGTDYTVSYSKNTKIGTGTATIKFRGRYTGRVVRKFKINPKGTSLGKLYRSKKSFSATWNKQTSNTTGYQLQYSTSKNFKKNKKTVTIKKNTTTYKNIYNLKANKKYYVRVRTYKTVGKTKYYSKWSKVKTVKTR